MDQMKKPEINYFNDRAIYNTWACSRQVKCRERNNLERRLLRYLFMKFMEMIELFDCSRNQFDWMFIVVTHLLCVSLLSIFYNKAITSCLPNLFFISLADPLCTTSLLVVAHPSSLPILFSFLVSSDSNKHFYITFLVEWHRKSLLPNSGNQTQSWLWTNKNRRFLCGSTSQTLSKRTSKRRTFSACSTKYAVVRSITSTFYASSRLPDLTFCHQP